MNCVLCGRNSGVKPSALTPQGTYVVHCTTCGTYEIDDGAEDQKLFDDLKIKPNLYRLSAMAKASPQPMRIDQKRLDELRDGVPRDKTVAEKVAIALRWFAEKTDQIGRAVQTDGDKDYPIAWCRGSTEWKSLLKYLDEVGHIQALGNPSTIGAVAVTVKGLQWLSDRPKATGSKAFIAMAFDPALNDVKAAIHDAIEKAGYDPLRVDDDHYSGGVMDRIITQIRDSKFIVADFTKNRGGVYYEAGVAFGLGIDVLNVCDAACLADGAADRLHFDVRHLVFVPWEVGQLDKFSEALCNHIVALHGRGPRPTT